MDFITIAVVAGIYIAQEIQRRSDQKKFKKYAEEAEQHKKMLSAAKHIRDKMILPGRVKGFEEF